LVVRATGSVDELARLAPPADYQPGVWPAQAEPVVRLWLQYLEAQTNAEWEYWNGPIEPPSLILHTHLADLNLKAIYDQNLAAEEAMWGAAPAVPPPAASRAMAQGEGEGEFEGDGVSCTISDLTQPFTVTSIEQDINGWTTITWESCPSFRYIVLSADELSTSTVWQERVYIGGDVNSNRTSWTDITTSNVGHRFYKVRRILGNSIAAGGLHSLAVRPDGTLWAWGFDEDGELGDLTYGDASYYPYGQFLRFFPVEVADPTSCFGQIISNAAAVAAGGEEFTVVADASGQVWTWGDSLDGVGVLGDGDHVRVFLI
jgi:Regulator of chromosome condensation (RCC1) repeat